jgi:hypothetical protein
MEVRTDLKILTSEYSVFRDEIRTAKDEAWATHQRYDAKFLTIGEELELTEAGLKDAQRVILIRESQLGFVRGVFGPTLLPALLSLANLIILLVVLSHSFGFA